MKKTPQQAALEYAQLTLQDSSKEGRYEEWRRREELLSRMWDRGPG